MMTRFAATRWGRAGQEAAPLALQPLAPVQQHACAELELLSQNASVVLLLGAAGLGKSTILRHFAHQNGGRIITLSEVAKVIAPLDGYWYESGLADYLRGALAQSELLILDGVMGFLNGARTGRLYMHRYMLLELLYRDAEKLGKKLVISGTVSDPGAIAHHYFHRGDLALVEMAPFSQEDYRQIVSSALGADKAAAIHFGQLFRFASLLNGYELHALAGVVADLDSPTTEDCIEAIQEFIVSANTNTREVEDVRFEAMPGMESIAAALDTHVVTPLTDLDLAEELDLKAKRGVLLYGPPGTGKTSIGRALAHKLKGRFFLIDGSVRTEPAYHFLEKVQAIVNDAIENAPSVIFIDDADVLFDVAHVSSLTRYLLTLMDGLTGTNASKVCVMMTAMDAGKIPQAILRSGRVELWLETRLPDASTRAGIMRRWMGADVPVFENTEFERLGDLTQNFTPADIRRVVSDAKALYAMDRVRERAPVSGTAYLESAIADMVASREAMATNLADPSLRVG